MTQILADYRSPGSPDFWCSFSRNLYQAVSRARFDTWLARLGLRAVDGETLELVAPNAFTKDWVQRHYLDSIGQAARAVDGAQRVVRVLQAADLDSAEKESLTFMGTLLMGESGRAADLGASSVPGLAASVAEGLSGGASAGGGHPGPGNRLDRGAADPWLVRPAQGLADLTVILGFDVGSSVMGRHGIRLGAECSRAEVSTSRRGY